MRAWMLLVALLVTPGCVSAGPGRKPTWEIGLSVGLEYKADPFTTEKVGIEIKRPVGGSKEEKP
jgi:hypothetical protein